jgi:hypothetical protein
VYGSGQRRYMAFCSGANLSPLPLVEHTLCMFVTYLATHQTIKSYLSAIRRYHILAGQGDPFTGNPFPQQQYVLRGIKRSPAHSPRVPCMPITPAILRTLRDQWATAAIRDKDFVMLGLLREFLRIYEGRRIRSHPCVRILPGNLPVLGGHRSGPCAGAAEAE